MRARDRNGSGSVVLDKRSKTWSFYWYEDGRRRSKKIGTKAEFPTKAAAWRAAKPLRDRVESKTKVVVDEDVPTVQQVVDEYREEREPKRLSTRRSYEVWIGNYILPEWGEYPITSLQQPRPVQLWLNSLAPKLGSKSRREIQARLRNIIDYAQFAGYLPIERNPMELIRIPGSSKRTREPRSLTVEEFKKFLEYLDEPFHSIALLCGLLGLRISEGLALKWLDLNWLQLEVKIERGIVAGNVDDVKTRASEKALHLSQELINVLKNWRQITEFSADDDWIFASPAMLGKKPWSYYTVRRKFLEAAKEAGIGWLGTHSMRHSFRSWLDGVGTNVTIQQKAMRHSNIGITMKYGDSDRGAIAEAQEKVSALVLAPEGMVRERVPF